MLRLSGRFAIMISKLASQKGKDSYETMMDVENTAAAPSAGREPEATRVGAAAADAADLRVPVLLVSGWLGGAY